MSLKSVKSQRKSLNELTLRIERFCNQSWSLVREDKLISLDVNYAEVVGIEGAWIARLFSPAKVRGRGYAREAMERLCEAANDESIVLLLVVSPYADCPMTYTQLMAFYESFGFEEHDMGLMVRHPE